MKKGVCRYGLFPSPLKLGIALHGVYLSNNKACHYSNSQLLASKCDGTRELPTTKPPSQKAFSLFVLEWRNGCMFIDS